MVCKVNGQQLNVPGKLEVVSCSTLPVSKVQEREEAIALFDKGVIDAEELLKKMEWDDRKSVIERMKRGPVGIAMQRLVDLGLPPEIAEYFTEIGVMDDKDFEKSLQAGELPGVFSVLFPPEAGAEPQDNPVENAEINKTNAEIDKIRAEIKKIEAETEAIIAGEDFDKDKLAIERARTVSDIQSRNAESDRADVKTASDIERAQQDGERQDLRTASDLDKAERAEGRADQAEKRAEAGEKREDKRLASEIKTKEMEQKAQGPYREKGLKSNNKKD